MLVQPRRRLWWLIVVIVILLIGGTLILIISGHVRINGPIAGAGDPGNKRLHELRNDPIFTLSQLPSGAHVSGPLVTTPATYRQPVFDGGGWETPTVALTFIDDQPAAIVYQFYDVQAAAAGWRALQSQRNQFGYTDQWTKTYPDHATASLRLFDLGNTPQGHSYELGGGISIVQ